MQKSQNSIDQEEIIISLTSFPARIAAVNRTIETLLNQTKKADKIILWLAEDEIPSKEKELPAELLEQTKRGLSIAWIEKSRRSYNKLIPTLSAYPDSIIVTADDDKLYPLDWLEKLYRSYKANPEFVHCHRAHRIRVRNGKVLPYRKWWSQIMDKEVKPSFLNFLTGVNGVLYPPRIFYKDVLNEDLFVKLAPTADDIWFWAMVVLNNIKIHVVKGNNRHIDSLERQNKENLRQENVLLGKNDVQIVNVLAHYPELMEKIRYAAHEESSTETLFLLRRMFLVRCIRKLVKHIR